MIDNNALVQQTPANDRVEERHHAIAVAVATAAAAEAAVASAHAAMEVARLARPSTVPRHYNNYDYAATLIQTAFRGYLVSFSPFVILRTRSASPIQFVFSSTTQPLSYKQDESIKLIYNIVL